MIEVKCPYGKKHTMLDVDDKGFYLKKDHHGSMKLDRGHAYFYQIQKLCVCKLESAYFVVWTENDMHFEEIVFNEQFWVNICVSGKHIFSSAILPELVGKFNTRLFGVRCSSGVSVDNGNEAEKRWCYCAQVGSGRMLKQILLLLLLFIIIIIIKQILLLLLLCLVVITLNAILSGFTTLIMRLAVLQKGNDIVQTAANYHSLRKVVKTL